MGRLKCVPKGQEKYFEKAIAAYACFIPMREAKEIVEGENEGLNLNIRKLYEFSNTSKGKRIIRECKERYLKEIVKVPIYHKRVRLDRLEKAYKNCEKAIDRVKVLEQARKEVEGESGDLYLQLNNFQGMSDQELQARREKILKEIKKEVERLPEGAVVDVESKEVQDE